MDQSFGDRQESPVGSEKSSYVISDSEEEEIVDYSGKGHVYLIESSDTSENPSTNATPRTSINASPFDENISPEIAIRRRVKQYLQINSDEESAYDDIADDSASIHNDSEEDQVLAVNTSSIDGENPSDSSDVRQGKDDLAEGFTDDSHESTLENTINLDSTRENAKSTETNGEPELVLSLAKQEIGVGNIDPLVAQKRALLVCKMQQLKDQLKKTKLLFTEGNMDILPDKGERLRESIYSQEKEIQELAIELESTPLYQNVNSDDFIVKEERFSIKDEPQNVQKHFYSNEEIKSEIKSEFKSEMMNSSYTNKDNPWAEGSLNLPDKALGVKAQAKHDRELAVTVEKLEDLHGSLVTRPSEDQIAQDPRGLKVKLMPHQQHALAWLLWREGQKPSGGLLADDMGLGKTLTMISLIIAASDQENSDDSDSDNDGQWSDRKKPLRHKGGTLVVCPASLLAQWQSEIKNKCKRGLLSVEIYHGCNRESVPGRLAKNDVVITTYNTLTRSFKTKSTPYKINWKRVILDEAHVIRNHKSQASEAACELHAQKRWALSGTPIQNKEMDLYAILKFLKCSPFDDLGVWKRWVDVKNNTGRQRLATLLESILLRRTKEELLAKGALESLPEKFIEEISVILDPSEQLVYEKVLIYSRTLFAQFLAQRAEKEHTAELGNSDYSKPYFLSKFDKNTHFTEAQKKLLSQHEGVKAHEILVLLLRLRQVCCHPALIHAMLDQDDIEESGLAEADSALDPNLLLDINKMSLNEKPNDDETLHDEEIGVDRRVASNLLTSKNPVFEDTRKSSKMRAVLKTVNEILRKGDKLVIVSQWTSMLDIVGSHLSSIEGATFAKFTGNTPIKERQGIMDAFNDLNGNPKILLLSLTAGGVGLNLVGGNHLLLIDVHWNPQLETQAQDRVYRFGQSKNVMIYKFVCKDTIEERIRQLQETKLCIAKDVLTGSKGTAVSKLTLNDLKSLFAL